MKCKTSAFARDEGDSEQPVIFVFGSQNNSMPH